jgi:hypothetical protein
MNNKETTSLIVIFFWNNLALSWCSSGLEKLFHCFSCFSSCSIYLINLMENHSTGKINHIFWVSFSWKISQVQIQFFKKTFNPLMMLIFFFTLIISILIFNFNYNLGISFLAFQLLVVENSKNNLQFFIPNYWIQLG